jgi:hypothetical protein
MDTNELENKAQADEQNEDPPAEQGGALSATESQSHLSDLEPRDEVKGGEHILLARQVWVP